MPRARIAEGLELNYEVFGDDDAPAVVLVRGTGADGTRWMPQVEAHREEFRVVIFDNRGVGGSDTPPGPYTVADMANDTVALLDVLGIDRCHLSGSRSGAICCHIAIEQPQRVRSLQLHSSWLATRGYTAYSLGLLMQFLEVGGVDFYYDAALPLLFSPQSCRAEHERLMGVLAHMKAHPATFDGLHGQLEATLRTTSAPGPVRSRSQRWSRWESSTTSCRWQLRQSSNAPCSSCSAAAPHLVTMETPEHFNEVTLSWLRKVKDCPGDVHPAT